MLCLLGATGKEFVLNMSSQVMHDVHDHVAALARFFPGLPFRVNPVLDLELVGEALGGDALNNFGSALWSFDVCKDPAR